MPEPDATATRSDDARVAAFVGKLVMFNFDEYTSTSRILIDSLTAQVSELRATIDAIREGVGMAFSGPYAPSQAAIMAALFPPRDIVATYRKETQA